MEEYYPVQNKGKQKIIMAACILAGICLAGIALIVGAVFQQKNPLAAGLAELAGEVAAKEAELGEYFWTDVIDQIGAGNVQAEYSFNIGNIPALQNITVGLDGEAKRDMEEKVFQTDLQVSVTNARLTAASLYGNGDTLFVQVPSIWEGSVVFDTENVSGQWNDSPARKQLQELTQEELGVDRKIDIKMLEGFSVERFSASEFLEKNEEALKALYENMETEKTEKAQKKGMISREQAEVLEGYKVQNAEGERIETICYLAVLPEKELRAIFPDITGSIRLGVYLDQEKRIVRIATLPGEVFVTNAGESRIGLNLTGGEAVTDRLELEISDISEADKIFSGLTGKMETEGSVVVEKDADKKGAYDIKCSLNLTYQDHIRIFSAEGSVQGEQEENGKRLFLNVENMTWGTEKEVLCRFSGKAAFEPLAEEILLPSGKEYRVDEMNEMETAVFLAECVGNVYKNYSGYLKMLQ